MIILNADFPAGMTIEEAIGEALDLSADLSQNVHVMIRCDINDKKIGVVSGLLPRNKAIEYYRGIYDEMSKPKDDKEQI